MIIAVEGDLPEGPADLRLAARRGLDLWLAAGEDVVAVRPTDPRAAAAGARLVVREMEAAVLPGSLSRAARALSAGAASVVPEGFWPGSPRAAEPYSTLWELEHLAATGDANAAPARAIARGAGATAPVVLETRSRAGPEALAFAMPGFLVHSFASRRAHSRPEVSALVPEAARRILEVGCAEGALGAALEAGGARVTGIEPDPAGASLARPRLSELHEASLEEALPRLRTPFDAVVMADVLEHLEDPVAALRALRGLLSRDGRLVVSVPNASNAAVLAGILQGRFDPALEGIVADDHRTYAGRAGWTRLLRAGGFAVESWRAVPLLSPLAERWLAPLSERGLSDEDLRAYQWLGVARAASSPEDLDLGPSASPAGFLSWEDPIGDLTQRLDLAKGPLEGEVLNAAAAVVGLELLLRGEVVTGEARRSLHQAVTARGLAARFRGSGVRLSVSFSGTLPLPTASARTVDAARRAGLPVDAEALAASTLRLRAERS